MYYNQSNAARFIYTLNNYIRLDDTTIALLSTAGHPKQYIDLTTMHLGPQCEDPDDGCDNDSNIIGEKYKTINEMRNGPTNTELHMGSTVHKQYGCILNSNKFWFAKEARSDEKVRFTETELADMIRTILFMYVFNTQPNESLLDIINTGEVTFPDGVDTEMQQLTVKIADQLIDTLFGRNFAVIAKRALVKCLTEYETVWRNGPFNYVQIKAPSALDIQRLAQFVNVTSPHYSRPTQFINNNSSDNRIPLQNNYKHLS